MIGPVRAVIVVLLRRGNLAQPTIPGLVKAVDLVQNIRVVQVDVAKADKAVGMLVNIFGGFREALLSDQKEADTVGCGQLGEHLVQHLPRLPVEVLMHVDEFWRSRLRGRS